MDCRCSAKRVKKVDSRDDYVLPIAKKKQEKLVGKGVVEEVQGILVNWVMLM